MGRKKDELTQSIIDKKIMRDRIKGAKIKDLCAEYKVGPDRICKILSSEEYRKEVERVKARIMNLADLAVDTILFAMEQRGESVQNLGIALKAAIPVLESVGAITKNLEVKHEFPKPTIIKRFNGEVIEIGAIKQVNGITHESNGS